MKSSRKRKKKHVASCTENDVTVLTGDSNDKLSNKPNGTHEELLQSDLTNKIFVGNISYRVSVVRNCTRPLYNEINWFLINRPHEIVVNLMHTHYFKIAN